MGLVGCRLSVLIGDSFVQFFKPIMSLLHSVPVQVKTAFWDSLPWYLCSLAVPDESVARQNASEVIRKFDSEDRSRVASSGRAHRMTQRFCNYDFVGDDETDIPLRPSLDEFIAGRPRSSLPALSKWLGAFRLMRTNEQETEACVFECQRVCMA